MLRPGPAPADIPPPPRDLALEAVELFQPHYREPLTPADGREITRNLTDFLGLLADWKQAADPGWASPPAPHVTELTGTVPEAPQRRPRGRKFKPETP